MGLFDKLFGKRMGSASTQALSTASDVKPTDFNAEQVFAVRKQRALGALDELLRKRAASGLVPALLGGSEDLRLLLETRQFGEEDGLSVEKALEKASTLNVERWLSEAAAQRASDAEEDAEILNDLGTWPVFAPSPTKIETHLEVPNDQVYLAAFRTDASWKVPALLLWCSLNYDMGPDIHTAMHGRWNNLYGSELVSITGSVIQCYVSRPPQTKEEAMKLAWEHYYYCPDIVWQGVGTVSGLAAALLKADVWYFWWD